MSIELSMIHNLLFLPNFFAKVKFFMFLLQLLFDNNNIYIYKKYYMLLFQLIKYKERNHELAYFNRWKEILES